MLRCDKESLWMPPFGQCSYMGIANEAEWLGIASDRDHFQRNARGT